MSLEGLAETGLRRGHLLEALGMREAARATAAAALAQQAVAALEADEAMHVRRRVDVTFLQTLHFDCAFDRVPAPKSKFRARASREVIT